jgi:hypothetical protein
MKMRCIPPSPGMCDTKETDGRATVSWHGMFQRNMQYRDSATVLTDVICFDDGFGGSLSEWLAADDIRVVLERLMK